MDIGAIGSLLSSIKTATDILKFVRESDLSIEQAETKLKLADLVSALADIKIEAAEIQQLLLERDEEIRKLKSDLKLKGSLRWEQPCYYLTNNDGGEDPYCQNCRDANDKLSRLHDDGEGRFFCSVCKTEFKTKNRIKRDEDNFQSAIRGGAR